MKIQPHFSLAAGRAPKVRMEELLMAWRQPRPPHSMSSPHSRDEGPQSNFDWATLLAAVRPVPPRSHISGLAFQATIAGTTTEQLVRDGAARTAGSRVSMPWLAGREGTTQFGGHSWSVAIHPSALGLESESGEQTLRAIFREVDFVGDEVFLSNPFCQRDDIAALLVAAASRSDDVFGLWRVSRALNVHSAFVSFLPIALQTALACEIRAHLLAVRDHLGVLTDVSLHLFSEGQRDSDPERALRRLSLPDSRFGELVEAAEFFNDAHVSFVEDYFEDIAEAYVLVAEAHALGDTMKALPPGRALLAMIDAVCSNRPELIATYVWHHAFRAEGTFAMLRLAAATTWTANARLDLSDEWREVQRLGRELAVVGERNTDWPSLIALGVYDELCAEVPAAWGKPRDEHLRRDSEAMWRRAITEPEDRSTEIVGATLDYLQSAVRRTDAGTVFALRLLSPLRASGRGVLAQRLASSIVASYSASLRLDAATFNPPNSLSQHGQLLSDLYDELHAAPEMEAAWSRWLRPFDLSALLSAVDAADTGFIDSRFPNPAYDVPRLIRAHAETLAAQAAACPTVDELLDSVLGLVFNTRQGHPEAEAFSWSSLARTLRPQLPSSEPLFTIVGRLLSRSPRGQAQLEELMERRPEAHILAYALVGLAPDPVLSNALKPQLRGLINELLADEDGLALGHALELANTLLLAKEPRHAERFARYGIEIADRFKAGSRFMDVARALLAGALAQQELWAEVLAIEVEAREFLLFPHKQFIGNMRAVAFMETGRFDDAERVLKQLLDVAPTNRVAHANSTALWLKRGEWARALEAAAVAKAVLPVEDWDPIVVNEALARERLGDRYAATQLFASLSSAGQKLSAALVLRDRIHPVAPLEVRTPDRVSVAMGDRASPLLDKPPPKQDGERDYVDVAIVTALHDEYEAVRRELIDPSDVMPTPQFPNLWGWVVGNVRRPDGSGTFRVALAVAGQSGNATTMWATMRTIERWQPRHLLFSGIAGGLASKDLEQGDVVLSDAVWYYEHGKMTGGKFKPRHRDTLPVDRALLRSATNFSRSTEVWHACGVSRPRPGSRPKCVPGLIGSGEKVVDDLKPEFVQAILALRPELHAIEMEAFGACSAIQQAREEGRSVGFLMVRSISDVPREQLSVEAGMPNAVGLGEASSHAGTVERDSWKPYACAMAAHFIVTWIGSPLWPYAPLDKGV